MKKTIFSIIFCCLLSGLSVFAQTVSDDSYKSVVQIVAYGDLYGKYPVLRGRGSASIISNDGLILTNNHVVSDKQGNPQSAFSICMSLSTSSRPVCNRTASLIAKNEQKDIALLRIDPIDVKENPVSYTSFRSAVLDYDYIPNPQDQTLAIGYPRVGADTITQTVGVVAGTQVYNDQTYIKTDTLIAPGNSGGPLLKDGKIIGINTFFQADTQSLGYALHVSQIKDFVASHRTESAQSSRLPLTVFQEYLSSSHDSSLKSTVSDFLWKIVFPKPYVITHYIAQRQLVARLQTPDSSSVQEFTLKAIQVSPMKSYDDFIYALKSRYGYNPTYMKLIKRTIGGLSLYQLTNTDDLSEGNRGEYRVYFGQYDENTIIELVLSVPSADDQHTQSIVKSNVESFLGGIQFVGGYVSPTSDLLEFIIPPLQLHLLSGMTTTLVDIDEEENPFAILQLDVPHHTITYTLQRNLLERGASQTLQQNFSTLTEQVPAHHKTLLSYRGNKGFAYCIQSNPEGQYIYTKQGSLVEMGLCRIELYLGIDQDYILRIDLNVEKNMLEKRQKDFLSLVKKTVILSITADGATDFPSSIMKKKPRGFADAKDQAPDYNNFLALLVQYGILAKGTQAGLERPITYKEYLSLYLHMVYNIKKDFSDQVFEKTSLFSSAYVDSTKLDLLDTLIRLRMAGVSLSNYSDKTLALFSNLADSKYRKQRSVIESFEYDIFQGDKFGIEKAGVGGDYSEVTYVPYIRRYYDPLKGALPQKIYNTIGTITTPVLNHSMPSLEQKLIVCGSHPIMDKSCIQAYKKAAIMNPFPGYGSYEILLRGEALAHLSSQMDIALFDTAWSDKK